MKSNMSDLRYYYLSDAYPLPLRDTCVLHVLVRLDEYPVQTLALLPRDTRRKLVHSLAPADILHLQDTAIFDGVKDDGLLSAASLQLVQWCLGHMDVVVHMDNFFSLRLFYKHFDDDNDHKTQLLFLRQFSKQYASLQTISVRESLIPSRFEQFACLWNTNSKVTELAEHVKPLMSYCRRIHPVCRCTLPVHKMAVHSPVWVACKAHLVEETLSSVGDMSPLLQDVVGNIETMELNDTDEKVTHKRLVPYVVLYHAVTAKPPHLKHLKMHSSAESILWMLNSVGELFSSSSQSTLMSSNPLQLPSLPHPYLLEELSIMAKDAWSGMSYVRGNAVSEETCQSISDATRSIVEFQLENLTHVTIEGLGFCNDKDINVPDYRGLLSTLAILLKQPQVQSVRVTRAPLSEAFQMIESFLSTPTTHEQTLAVSAIEFKEYKMLQRAEFSSIHPDGAPLVTQAKGDKPCPIKHQLPLTNASFKHLDLVVSDYSMSCGISTGSAYHWLYKQYRDLKLKQLTNTLRDINIVPLDLDLQVERICLCGEFRGPPISLPHLEKFIVTNTALKNLVIVDKYADIVPALNHCLALLIREKRGPDTIQVSPSLFLSEGDRVKIDFFTKIQLLSYLCGTILQLTAANSRIYQRALPKKFVSNLGEKFKGRKIKQIIYTPSKQITGQQEDPVTYLPMLADDVIVNDDDVAKEAAGLIVL